MIFALAAFNGCFVLLIDSVNWKLRANNINLLLLGLAYKNVAFSMTIPMLDKRGNSTYEECIVLMDTVQIQHPIAYLAFFNYFF